VRAVPGSDQLPSAERRTAGDQVISAGRLSEILKLPTPTEEQQAVIEAPLAPALVVAGAGSGKTETMAARVVFLVANQMVSPDQILGLTFTRKAASGLAARIRRRLWALHAAALIGDDGLPIEGMAARGGEPEVCTYHSFGGRLISEFGPLAGIEPTAKVLTATGSWLLARRVVGRWDGDLETDLGPDQVTERLLAMAGGLADHLTDSTALAGEIESVLARLRAAPPSPAQRGPVHSGLAGHLKRLQDRAWILPLVDAFTDAKRTAGVVDFADQMQVAAALTTRHPWIGDALQARYRVVLLDEYQDTGHAQRVILRSIFSARADGRSSGHAVTAVGDPVQSIYSWRGASASNLPRFPTDFAAANGTPARTLSLSTSFRNSATVLEVANEVSLPVRTGRIAVKELEPRPEAPTGVVGVGLFRTVVDEEAWVARTIAEQWADAGWPPGGTDGSMTGSPRRQLSESVEGPLAVVPNLPPSTAVLMRRRRDMEPMAMALRAAGLPVEVVGLGGLLNEPEVADLVALLQVLVSPTAGPAAVRLLTGARWQFGMADLATLAARASALSPRQRANPVATDVNSGPSGSGSSSRAVVGVPLAADAPDAGRATVREALEGAVAEEDVDAASLIDAISDPGSPEAYSSEAFRRLVQLGAELQRLRGKLSLPLPDLIAELERTSRLDVEVRVSSAAGRAHLDAFADVVADFAAGGGGPTELLEYLLTAADREDGLAPGEVAAAPGRVQILTVHAAKGLEWEIVAIPHLSDTVFPGSRGSTWLGDAAQLPPAVRGDRVDLPELRLPPGGNQKDMVDVLADHAAELKAEHAVEERRLLYVAVTRAERVLLTSGHHWGRTGAKPHGPSQFLTEIRLASAAYGKPDEWAAAPPDGELNPLTEDPRRMEWPVDPLGSRRGRVEAGAALVRAALAVQRKLVGSVLPEQDPDAGSAEAGSASEWSSEVAALLAERRALRSRSIEVALPESMSATALVELAEDPSGLARRIRRPVPHAPTQRARRGTALHAWLERFFTSSALMEISELPGANDGPARPDPELEALKTKFLASQWAHRVPFEVELPFSMTIAGQPIKGRIDAVFHDDDGGCTVVDWKSGRPPAFADRAALTVQLAIYRLAVSEILEMRLTDVRAAFVYIGTGETFAPADLLDAAGLAGLLRDATAGDEHAAATETGPWVTGTTESRRLDQSYAAEFDGPKLPSEAERTDFDGQAAS